jgi:hypothetical protein
VPIRPSRDVITGAHLAEANGCTWANPSCPVVNLFVNTWEIAPCISYRPRAFRPLAAYHQSVHQQLVAVMVAPIRGFGRFATGAAEV